MSIPRTTHPWLQPLFNVLEGRVGRPLQLGSATGYIGLFGASGIQRPTGVGATGGNTGASGIDALRSSGGLGSQFYTFSDIVKILKQRGDITT